MLSFPRMLSRDIRPWSRLLEELEAAAAPQSSLFKTHNLNYNSFTPSFDVKETKDSYVLDGELPGISDKSAIDLSFVDDNTLVIKGRIERKSETGRPASKGTTTEHGEETTHYQAPTVEEEEGSSNTEQAMTKTSNNNQVQQQPKDTDKYWVRERYVGEFQRAFSFPQNVDHDAVKASLKDGILSVVIPKKIGQHGVRKITVQ